MTEGHRCGLCARVLAVLTCPECEQKIGLDRLRMHEAAEEEGGVECPNPGCDHVIPVRTFRMGAA